jgi:ABC-type sugar transport system permease subunit
VTALADSGDQGSFLPQRGRDPFWLLISPILFAYVAFFAAPMVLLVVASVSPETGPAGFRNWVKFLSDTYYLTPPSRR